MSRPLNALPPLPERFLDGNVLGAHQGDAMLGPLALPTGLVPSLREKRWHWIGIATPERFVTCALVHVGYAASAFAFVGDPRGGPLLRDRSFLAIPGVDLHVGRAPDRGVVARFQRGGNRIALSRGEAPDADWSLELSLGDFAVSARFAVASPPALAVVGDAVPGHRLYTRKRCPLAVEGTLTIGSERLDLGRAGALAGMDYTAGRLPRRTAWRWGFALGRSDGEPTAFNLAEGNNLGGQNENALWHDGRLVGLPPVRFTVPAEPGAPWTLRSDDGAVDLRFQGQGLHREQQNLLLVRSRFVQIAGRYTGTILDGDRAIAIDLPGVSEDQDTVW